MQTPARTQIALAPRPSADLVDSFLKEYVPSLMIGRNERLGVGVLLGSRLVATCRHVVEEYQRVTVRLGEERPTAKVFCAEGSSEYDDVALLVLDDDLGRPPFPMLVEGITDRRFGELWPLLAPPLREQTRWRTAGDPKPGPMSSHARITSCHIGRDRRAARFQLDEGYVEGWSGGPVWIVPDESERSEWGPGLVIGNLSRSGKEAGRGFASTSDVVLGFRDRLLTGGQLSNDESSALAAVRSVDARELVRSYLRPMAIDFSGERARHARFVGRQDIILELDAWLEANERGWLLISGSPGLGKSALCDQWLRRRQATEQPTACHFIRRDRGNWSDPATIRANLATQIELLFIDDRDPTADPHNRLEHLLQRISPQLVERGQRLVLLVDGLDEISALGHADPLFEALPTALVDRIFVVATSRPHASQLSWLDRRGEPISRIDLDTRVESNERAVRGLWESLAQRMTPPLSDQLKRAAVEGAEGNMLHAVKLFEWWQDGKTTRSATAVPQGFDGTLKELWRRAINLPAGQRTRVRDGLSLLCAAREPLPTFVIEELLGWDQGDAQDDLLLHAREVLIEESWQGISTYRPFHEGFRERVVVEQSKRIARHHATLADYTTWPSTRGAFVNEYALRHLVTHLVESGRPDDAAKRVMDIGYLTAKACTRGVGVASVERDVALAAWAQVDAEARERLLAFCRTIRTCAHWVTRTPEALPALLHDRALTNAPQLIASLFEAQQQPLPYPRLRHPLQVRGTPRVLRGHRDSVDAVAVLPDGHVASGSYDNSIRVWDLESGRTLLVLQGHEDWVRALLALPDGRIVSGSDDQTIRVWDSSSGRRIAEFHGHEHIVRCLARLHDGRVVSGSYDRTLRVWDIATGHSVVLRGHDGAVNAVATLTDGRIVSGSSDHTLRVWAPGAKTVTTLLGHRDSIDAVVALSSDRVASASSDHDIRVWDLQTGRTTVVLRGHQGPVTALSIHPDGSMVSGSEDQSIRVWDPMTGHPRATLRGHQRAVTTVATLPDRRIVSGSLDGTLRVWDPGSLGSEASSVAHRGLVSAVTVLPSDRVVSASWDGSIRVWDTRTGRAVASLRGLEHAIDCIASLPDGRVIFGSTDGCLRTWDEHADLTTVVSQGHQAKLTAVVVLSDGRVVSGSSDRSLRVMNTGLDPSDIVLRGHDDKVSALVALPNGRVVSSSYDETLRIWDLESRRTLRVLEGHRHFVNAVALLPNGRVVSGSSDGTLRVWTLDDGRSTTLSGHTDRVTTVATSPGGRIVSGSYDDTLRIWDAGEERTVSIVHGDAAFISASFIDERFVVAGDAIGNVWFIDLPHTSITGSSQPTHPRKTEP